jgi:RNA-directed DNA polymerase
VPRQSSTGSAAQAKQGAETATASPDWTWVEAEVWTDRMLSALGNGVKGGKWYSLIDKVYAHDTLALAWTKVEANKGAAGVDGQSVERFAARTESYLSELATALRAGKYCPQAVKRVEIPKGDGRTRPLGIPTVKDRIVQQAVRLVIEPIFESGSATAATASVRDAGAMTRCAWSTDCSRKVTPMWLTPTCSRISTRSRTIV